MITILDLKQAPQHLKTLAQWHLNEWSHFNPGESIQQRIDRMHPFFNDAFVPSTFIATDTKLLGSAAIVTNDMETRVDLSPWLASVYVDPAHRCKGTGTKLVRHIMHLAKTNGIKKLYLFTPDQEKFYEKLGWKTISRESYRGQEVAVMQVRLSDK
jgi:GNAT superfamily N-acetyltransferase